MQTSSSDKANKMDSAANMAGRVCLITGASGGLGKATALGLARLGASVIMTCRDEARGEVDRAEIVAASGNRDVRLMCLDLASQQSVRELAANFKAEHSRLDVLINNASVFKGKRTVTSEGLETMFATNHLGHFLLTNLLLDELKASPQARVINIAAPLPQKSISTICKASVNSARFLRSGPLRCATCSSPMNWRGDSPGRR